MIPRTLMYKNLFRFLLTLKSFVRNRAHPEGAIAEGFLALTNECLIFCSQYLSRCYSTLETRFNKHSRNDDTMMKVTLHWKM